jgi:serine/threonine-protein kinase RsbW
MADPRREKVVIASRLAEIPPLVESILAAVTAHGYDDDAQFAIRLCLDEAISNAVRHGNCGDPQKKVTVEYAVDAVAFTITICDQGCGFRPDKVPDPTLDENLEKPCGRGVLLMQAYMTQVSFNPSGNCVSMVKRRDCTKPKKPRG